MVRTLIESDDERRSRDRAQLILVGAVTLALIIIGLTIVLNTILFTDTVTTAVTSQDGGDANEFDFDARRDVRSLLLRLNHRERNVSEDTLEKSVQRNLTNYTRLLQESYAVDKPVFVNISHGDVEFGQRFVQAKDGAFTSPDGDEDWTPVDPSGMSGPDPDVGWLVTDFNVTETDASQSDPVTIQIRNESKYVNISFTKIDDGGVQEIEVGTERNFGQLGNTSDEPCVSVRGRVLLDVLRGSSYTGDCQFNATQGLEPPFTTVRFWNGSRADGQFSIVVNQSIGELDTFMAAGSSGSYQECPASPTDPCQSPVVWQTNVTVAYGGRTVDYERSHEVNIYP